MACGKLFSHCLYNESEGDTVAAGNRNRVDRRYVAVYGSNNNPNAQIYEKEPSWLPSDLTSAPS